MVLMYEQIRTFLQTLPSYLDVVKINDIHEDLHYILIEYYNIYDIYWHLYEGVHYYFVKDIYPLCSEIDLFKRIKQILLRDLVLFIDLLETVDIYYIDTHFAVGDHQRLSSIKLNYLIIWLISILNTQLFPECTEYTAWHCYLRYAIRLTIARNTQFSIPTAQKVTSNIIVFTMSL